MNDAIDHCHDAQAPADRATCAKLAAEIPWDGNHIVKRRGRLQRFR